MRITCDMMANLGKAMVPVRDETGRVTAHVWRHHLSWLCSDGTLHASLINTEPVPVPAAENSEPIAGALGRLQRAVAGTGGVVLLENPASALGAERIMLAAGVRLFAITTDADMECWDAALTQGIPVFGVRGVLSTTAVRPDAFAFLSALAYGTVICEEGLQMMTCDETPQGVDLAVREAVSVSVIISGGYEAAQLNGTRVTWRDRGNERYVRLFVQGSAGRCWTQPRFVAQQHRVSSEQAHEHC